MGGSQKSKRITWASDVNLCQVKLFLSEESPSKVGIKTYDHLQVKAFESDDNLPPGFEEIQPNNLWYIKSSQIPSIQWKCPPRFDVNIEWQTVAGEESKEMEAQNQREMRVLEAIYPRPSAIPPNPSVEVTDYSMSNDQNTPVVPLTPIEEDDSSQCNNNGISSTAAAQIDTHLLIKLLSNPKMIEQLVSSMPKIDPSSIFQTMPAIGVQKVAHNIPATTTQYVPPFDPIKNGPFSPPQIRTRAPSPCVGSPATKDINYYKSLIQKHGGEKQDFYLPQFDHISNQKNFVERKAKIMKPCVYFNSPRGCRNGANCAYQHDLSSQKRIGGFSEVRSVKRVKLDRGIAGI